MRLLLTALTALLLISTKAHAFFTIDYNEQWLRNDAYNRAMSQAKKDLEGSSSSRSSSRARARSTAPSARKPSTQADPLWTGKLVVLRNGEVLDSKPLEEMAQMVPAAQRKEAQTLFKQIVVTFNNNVENLYGVPKENVATGIVTLLAGGYAAYYNKPFPENAIKPTVEQVRTYLQGKPEAFKPGSERMRSYMQSVGLGMLLSLMQQEVQKSGSAADAAQLKAEGARVFRAVLHVEPEEVEFTSSGLRFR